MKRTTRIKAWLAAAAAVAFVIGAHAIASDGDQAADQVITYHV